MTTSPVPIEQESGSRHSGGGGQSPESVREILYGEPPKTILVREFPCPLCKAPHLREHPFPPLPSPHSPLVAYLVCAASGALTTVLLGVAVWFVLTRVLVQG